MAAKPKRLTKAQEWAAACTQAVSALETLEGLRSDWADIYENMTDGLKQTPYGLKLEEMSNLDLQSALNTVQEAEGLDTPLGFGRD
jgi:hypothetical protein